MTKPQGRTIVNGGVRVRVMTKRGGGELKENAECADN